ncbi:MAG: hypothetical protein IKE18_02815 [Oscillospiraceae bacterium]|nr:hypothetical protein [Oscillospiraceae bacterium]
MIIRNKIKELRQFIDKPKIRTGSLIRASGIRTNSTRTNATEEAALDIIEAREELDQLIKEDEALFSRMIDEIRNGPGDEATKDLIIYVYLYGIPYKRAAIMSGVRVKQSRELVEDYLRAVHEAGQTQQEKNDD